MAETTTIQDLVNPQVMADMIRQDHQQDCRHPVRKGGLNPAGRTG